MLNIENNLFQAINYYFDNGFYVFPINLRIETGTHKKKFESIIQWEKTRITRTKSLKLLSKKKFNSIAIRTDREVNLFILDVDISESHSGLKSLESLKIDIPKDTPCVITISGGIHFYFHYPIELEHISSGSKKNIYWIGVRTEA